VSVEYTLIASLILYVEVEYLIDACLQHTASADRIIVSDISNHWFNILNSDLGYQSQPFVSDTPLH